MINHLGKNPRNGGSPASEISININQIKLMLVFLLVAKWEEYNLVLLVIIKIDSIIKE